MNLFLEAWQWLTDASQWSGPGGIPTRVLEHLLMTAVTVALTALIAVPVGLLIGHTGRGSWLVGAVSGGARAIPTLGLLTLFGLWLGIGLAAPLLALIVLAFPSILASTYAGVQAIDPRIPQAARAIGFGPAQVVRAVELPLALPGIIGGVRAATLQVVATATLAAYTADFGLGRYLFAGLKSRDYAQMLGGAMIVIVLALALELGLAALHRAAARRAGGHPRRRTPDPGARQRPVPTIQEVS